MRKSLFALLIMLSALAANAQTVKPLLLRSPTLSKTLICFTFAGDLWTVSREGGDARRLTTGAGIETSPIFSPDGSTIAFTGQYEGNTDVYTVPAAGGVPKRLTTYPGTDLVVGWTPDGKKIIFASARYSYSAFFRLFTMPASGGFPTEIALPMATDGSLSPDSSHLAYVPMIQWQAAWKRYRGGQTKSIWIANLADASIVKVPKPNSNDFNPMWIGGKVYFLSDRDGPVSLYSYDVSSKHVSQLIKNSGLDFKSASAGPGTIVYEQFGSINLFDLATGKSKPVDIRIAGDLPGVRPHYVKAAKYIHSGRISPTGVRAVFEAREDVITAPAEKGDIRNLTNTPGVAERDPSWSPDGKSIAYFSDESGEYAIHLRDQSGAGAVKKISLGSPSSFFYNPIWSPDSKKIAFSDKRLNLWYVDVEKGTPNKVDTDLFDSFQGPIVPSWSPDSKWITYTRALPSHMLAVFIYSLDAAKTNQITDGLSAAQYPVFDKSGKYLYFAASTDIGETIGPGDMSGMNRPVTRSIYLAVLRKDVPSPLSPESDEEKVEKKEGEPKKPEEKPGDPVKIDFENIGQRIIALPLAAKNYDELQAGKAGTLFVMEEPLVVVEQTGPPARTVYKFDLTKRKADAVLSGVRDFDVSANGEKVLYRQGDGWTIGSADTPTAGAHPLRVAEMEVYVDPPAEWKQMYHETWRIERDFFYDPNFHGLNIAEAEKKYAPYLDRLGSREDLNYLFEEMLGELTCGHVYVSGGDMPEVEPNRGGLLGADYKIENGRYRFARIYNGENWNPGARAPLTQPGVNVAVGDYLIAVSGRNVASTDDIYSFFEGSAGKQTVIRVGPNPNGDGARDVTVVPISSEQGLRHLAWIEDNRRKVYELSGGKLAYVYLPNTAGAGYVNFNRYYFSQTDKQGAIIDERFNGGGYLADYMIEIMRRPMLNGIMTREGAGEVHPVGAIYGPKVMLINELAGSGGDYLPWSFKRLGVGKLVGHRTWGGLVGIGGYPDLIDGGQITAPRWAIYGLKGEFEVENVGIAPDYEVEFEPAAWRTGHDSQLEKAVQVAMEELKKSPPPLIKRPPYPNYHKK